MEANTKIFRYEFTAEIMNAIKSFSTIHQYDERKIYKEQWNHWYEEHKEALELEIRRMKDMGYVGDVKDKMFKAGRYYFRKKEEAGAREAGTREAGAREAGTGANIQKKTRNYITMMESTLGAMDKHITDEMENDAKFKPSAGYINFCENNIDILREEIGRMINDLKMDQAAIKDKLKKTYKNRYYIITRN